MCAVKRQSFYSHVGMEVLQLSGSDVWLVVC